MIKSCNKQKVDITIKFFGTIIKIKSAFICVLFCFFGKNINIKVFVLKKHKTFEKQKRNRRKKTKNNNN